MLTDPRPTFKEACQRHAVTIEHLVNDLNEHHILVVTPAIATLVYEQGRGRAEVIDCLLAALSRLAGRIYTRKDIGGFSFLTDAEMEAGQSYVRTGR
ncbi:MAG TPA: hypothetical protein VKR06_00950 [Ktedonosporobacter sp.]|nr:hypothetical protein [Ktedonosporobacter sp.]